MRRLMPWASVVLVATMMLGLVWLGYSKLREEEVTQARHAAAVEAIVSVAQGLAPSDVASAIEVQFGAKDVRAAPLLMVSNPPKIELTFTLDGMRHSVTYIPHYPMAKLMKVMDGQ